MKFRRKNFVQKAFPLCVFLFINVLIGSVQAGKLNPFDDDDPTQAPIPGPGPAPAPAPAPAPGPSPNPNNQVSYSCPDDDGKQYATGGVTFQLKCNHGTKAKPLGSTVAYTLKDCADQCAANLDCQSCDWDAPSGCRLKAEYIPTFPLQGQLTWFPTTQRAPPCPTNKSPTQLENPTLVARPKCLDDHDKSYMAPDGTYFYVKCCAHSGGGKELGRQVTATYQECLDLCSNTDLCKGAQFTAREKAGSQEPKNTCVLFDAGFFATAPCGNDAHDAAFTVDPPTYDQPVFATIMCSTDCPFANGQQYISDSGEAFHMDCSKRHGTKALYSDTQNTFKDCMDACGKLVACHSVDYQYRTRTCYYSSHQSEPAIDATGFHSAHSMGCAGACDKTKKCGCGGKGKDEL